MSIDSETRLGPVHLTVSDLDRSLTFYGEAIGLRLLRQVRGSAALAADGGTPSLVLTELRGARRKPARSTGLYHFAILLPTRVDLARALRRLEEMRHPLQGASDHLVSEALYLADPDGNGIEIYTDRPRDQWPRFGGALQMATEPLDIDGLLGELDADDRPRQGLPPATTIGHVHLHVADLDAASAFYVDTLGFDLVVRLGGSAAFVSAGGYHHHIGLNTWAGVGAPPPPPDAVGLRAFSVIVPDDEELARVLGRVRAAAVKTEEWHGAAAAALRDPSDNAMLLATPSTALPDALVALFGSPAAV